MPKADSAETQAKAREAWDEVQTAKQAGGVIPSQVELAEKYGIPQQRLSYWFKKWKEETPTHTVERDAAGAAFDEIVRAEETRIAKTLAAQNLELGRTARAVIFTRGSLGGVPAGEIFLSNQLGKLVIDVLNQRDELKALESENAKLAAQFRRNGKLLSAKGRVEIAAKRKYEFLELCLRGKVEADLDVVNSGLIDLYDALLGLFISLPSSMGIQLPEVHIPKLAVALPLVQAEAAKLSLREKISQEAQKTTANLIAAGAEIREAYYTYSAQKNIAPSQLEDVDLRQEIEEALDLFARREELQAENVNLKNALVASETQVRRANRLEQCLTKLEEFLELCIKSKSVGVDIQKSQVPEEFSRELDQLFAEAQA